MNKVFTDNSWKDYIYWQTEDRKTLKKINNLIEDICRNGNEGIGKPEPLKGELSGFGADGLMKPIDLSIGLKMVY